VSPLFSNVDHKKLFYSEHFMFVTGNFTLCSIGRTRSRCSGLPCLCCRIDCVDLDTSFLVDTSSRKFIMLRPPGLLVSLSCSGHSIVSG